MRSNLLVYFLIMIGFFACNSKELSLVRNGSTTYEIKIPENANEYEVRSANELRNYIQLITGVGLTITRENNSSNNHKIFIGNTNPAQSLIMAEHEIVIKTNDKDLIITGGNSKSILYAVYTFLENYLGCRFYSPEAEMIPNIANISIPIDQDYRYLPPITTRTAHSKLYYDNTNFADKRKVTHEAFPTYVPAARVHTFHVFVPGDKYYTRHPEYYALHNGKRLPTQLCLTNLDVFEIVKDTVASLFDQFPEAEVISVSQDDNVQYCQCDQCMAINDREGTPAGSVIEFVNKIAEEFPEKMISTLAYQYTRKAPKNLKPKENVLITLCSIECDRSAPIVEKCTEFADDLVAWGKLTDNIRIWDYTTQFTNFLAPFPNIYTLQPNIQLFRDNNAKWIFEQHSHQPSELFELRSYLTAKLLWDPSIDQDSIINDFLNGYYEEAAPFIQQYITTIHDEIKKDTDFFLFLYGDPSQGFSSFLRPELLRQYDQWYEEAQRSVQDKPDIIKRVRQARLSIDYAVLEAARINDLLLAEYAAPDVDDARRILFIGSSQTWGAGARDPNETFVRRIENALNQRANEVVICINGGISALRSSHLLDLYKTQWLDLQPDVVVINLSNNDTDPALLERNIDSMIQLSQARSIRVLLVLEPNSIEKGGRGLAEKHAVLRRLARQRGVQLVDMHAYLSDRYRRGFLWWDTVHLSSFGQRLFAERLVDALAQLSADDARAF